MPEDKAISKETDSGPMTELEKETNKSSDCPNRYGKIFSFYKADENSFHAEKCQDHKKIVIELWIFWIMN